MFSKFRKDILVVGALILTLIMSLSVSGGLDHYKCYQSEGKKIGDPVTLQDHFDLQTNALHHFTVHQPKFFCNPATKVHKDAEFGVDHLDNHLTFYEILGKSEEHTIFISNQFQQTELRLKKDNFLLVPTQKYLVDGRPPRIGSGEPTDIDHFRCYSVEGDKLNEVRIEVQDQFDDALEAVQVLTPEVFCTPARKMHDEITVGIRNADEHLTCYDVQPNKYSPHKLNIRNQFGDQTLKVRNLKYICAPTKIGAAEVLLTSVIHPSTSRRYVGFYSNPSIIKNDLNVARADEAVNFSIVAVDLNRDGHSDSTAEPSIPPILRERASCLIRDHRLSVWPVSGVESRDWTINNYRDLDPLPDPDNDNQELADYLVAGPQSKTYDGHRAVDIDIPSFREMDDGSSLIIAAIAGKVEDITENFPDRNTGWPSGCGSANNRVTVRHPDGFLFSYLHLKTNSVSDVGGLSVGDNVQPGDVLGVVGSAGCSTQAHLHFQVNDCDGTVVDPFLQNMWASPPGYNSPLGYMDVVINQAIPSGNGFIPFMKDPGPNDMAVLPDQIFNVGLMMGGGQPGDSYEFEIIDPDGDETGDGIFVSTVNSVQRRSWSNWNVMTYDEPGKWTFRIFVNNVLQGSENFYVSKYAGSGAFKIVRHGIPGVLFQYESDHAVGAGYRPQFVDAYDVNGNTYFNAYWDKGPGQWIAKHGLNGADYDTFVNDNWVLGYRIKSVDSYEESGIIKYAVIMEKLAHPGQVASHGQNPADYQTHFNDMKAAGKVPVIVSVAYDNGQRFITSVFETNTMGTFFAKSIMTTGEFQTNFNTQDANGKSLFYVNSYNTPGDSPRFSGVWVTNPPFVQYGTDHDQSGDDFQNNFNLFDGQGFTVSIISGYEKNNKQRFAGHWTK